MSLHQLVECLRRRVSPARARLVVELVGLRRRAATKFTAADRMFFTRTALEQATDEWVAAYKASRFPKDAPVADLCCGIGGDLLALAARGPVVGVDRDPLVAHFAVANARVFFAPSDGARLDIRVQEAQRSGAEGALAWHIDPHRRPHGRRTSSTAFSSPDATVIERLLIECRHAAVKLAPGARVPQEWADRCELEWISRGGECRQLVAWHGDLATNAGRRRATIVTSAACGLAHRSLVGKPNQAIPIATAPQRFVFDCDPAVLAAHLKGALASEHGLSSLGAGPTYLTGPEPISDAALASFEVLDTLPLRTTAIANYLRERGVCQLEIKKRGVDVDPEKLRRSLKLRGDRAAVLLITPIADRPAAILTQRMAAS
jgi:hypothetical protein